jgi:plasmid stability protein
MAVMATERIRLTFDVPDRVRRALGIRAARKNASVGQIIESMAEQLLQKELADADEEIAAESSKPKEPRRKT